MSGKHDKKLDDEQSAKLLLTGPIVIRGLRRSVKEALLPGRPSRHRAFIAEGEDGSGALTRDDVVPIEQMFAEGPTVAGGAPSSELADAPHAQAPTADDLPFPSAPPVPHTGAADGPGEDRVDDRREGDAPLDESGEQQHDVDGVAALKQSPDVPDVVESAAEADGYDDAEADAFVDAAEIEAAPSEGQPRGDEPVIDFGEPDQALEDDDVTESVADGSEGGGSPEDGVGLPDDVAQEAPTEHGVEAAEERIEQLAEAEPDEESSEAPEGAASGEDEKPRSVGPDEAIETVADFGDSAGEAPILDDIESEPASDSVEANGVGDSAAQDSAEPGEPEADLGLGLPDGVATESPTEDEVAAAEERIEQLAEAEPDVELTDAPEGAASGEDGPADATEDPIDDFVVEDEPEVDQQDVVPDQPEAEPAADESLIDEDEEHLDGGTEGSGESEHDASAEESAAEGDADQRPEDQADPEDVALEESSGGIDAEFVAETTETAVDLEPPADEEDERLQDDQATDHAVEADAEEPSSVGDQEPADAAPDVQQPATAASDDEPAAEATETAMDVEPASNGDIGQLDDPQSIDESMDSEPTGPPAADEPEGSYEAVADDATETVDQAEPTDEGATASDPEPVEAPEATDDAQSVEAAAPVDDEVDGATEDGAAESEAVEPEPETALAEFLGERGWTTAEELYSRPISLPVQQDGIESDAPEPEPSTETPGEGVPQGVEVLDAPEKPVVEPGATNDSEAAESPAEDEVAPATDADDSEEPEPVVAAAAVAAPAAVSTKAARPTPKPERTSRPPRHPRPVRERFGREAIGIAVLVVLALVCGGLITAVVLKTQKDAAVAAQEAANYTPPPLATPTPTATGPVVAVIGDGTTSAAASGVSTAKRWSALLGTALSGTVTTDAASDMGYAAKSGAGETFVQAAAKVPSNAEVVVFFGGAADKNVSPLSLAKAATDAFSAAKTQAPKAKLIVVGPVISGGASASDLTAIRNGLRTAASVVKATWVDPIGDEWLPAAKQTAGSSTALSASDEKTIESKMEAQVKKALG